MRKPDLEDLVRLARRDRPPAGSLEAVARRLRVPFVVVPLAAAVLPSSAVAGILGKLGVSGAKVLGWSAGAALAVTGGALVLTSGASRPLAVAVAPPAAQVVASAPDTPPVDVAPAPAPEARPLPTSSERPRPREAPTPWDEPRLIERARKALGTEPQRALALAQEHQRRFPSGALALEREVIAIEAVARLGRVAEARRRALAFEAQHPSSIHLPRVRSVLTKLGPP